MESRESRSHPSFRALEQKLTYGVLADLLLFLLMLYASFRGVLWLKIVLGVLAIVTGGAGCTFLVLIQEHRRSRSWWILTAFGAIALCALVSLITGAPFPKA